MKCINLSIDQMEAIFRKRMVVDFPSDELKPLVLMQQMMNEGTYECYGLVEKDENVTVDDILAYAFFVKRDNHYLFDYLAVKSDTRNAGIGSEFLQLLREKFKGADSVIGEVEDFELAETEAERSLQKRRYGFYMRNGLVDTGVKVKMFGVDYIILELGVNGPFSEDEMKELYEKMYRFFVPEEMYEKNVFIK